MPLLNVFQTVRSVSRFAHRGGLFGLRSQYQPIATAFPAGSLQSFASASTLHVELMNPLWYSKKPDDKAGLLRAGREFITTLELSGNVEVILSAMSPYRALAETDSQFLPHAAQRGIVPGVTRRHTLPLPSMPTDDGCISTGRTIMGGGHTGTDCIFPRNCDCGCSQSTGSFLKMILVGTLAVVRRRCQAYWE